MKQITTVLIDLSGTLHIDNTVIPGAVQALNRYCLFTFLISIYTYVCMYCATVYVHAYIYARFITGNLYSARVKMARFNFKFLNKEMETYFLSLFCTTLSEVKFFFYTELI